jgi:hypothetical protein
MTHHLLPHIERDWLDALTHVFLIREPREMITSYLLRRETMTLADTGLPQQLEIFERVTRRLGQAPPVIDSRDVLENPGATLAALCETLGLSFSEKMLRWPAGRRATDGVWAQHWYDAVEASTRFQPYKPKTDVVPDDHGELLRACDEIYDQLNAHRIGG